MTREVVRKPVFELSVTVRVTWQAHSLSNAGNNGSNRLLARRQLLADGVETDACNGNILKHMHAVLAAEYLESLGVLLCPACARRDGRRAGALIDQAGSQKLTMESILQGCGLCDVHGFLIPAKHASSDGSSAGRSRLSKHTLVDFSLALALPELHKESTHLKTRMGDSKEGGQMLMKVPARSGEYAWNIRYKSVGIGVDTEHWRLIVADSHERQLRHQATLSALRDALLSPEGALTGTQLPHLTGLCGAVVLRQSVGRAQIYSALADDFVTRLRAMADTTTTVFPFEAVDSFYHLMNGLIETTEPAFPNQDQRSSGEDTLQRDDSEEEL